MSTTILACTNLGEYLADNVCTVCGDNCLLCLDNTGCWLCEPGYGPATASACAACTTSDDNVVLCADDLTTPILCADGYGIINDACTACGVDNCGDCTEVGKCTSCITGYS